MNNTKHTPVEPVKSLFPWVDGETVLFRIGNFLVYSLLSVVVLVVVWKVQPGRPVIASIGLLVLFTMATEILQYLVDGRTPRISDFLVDVSGVILGLLISFMLSPSMMISLKREDR